MKVSSVFRVVGWILVGLAGAAVLGLALGLVVEGLWNWLMPALFGLTTITYWQAVGLFVLCHLLFKGHHAGHRDGAERKKGHWGKFAQRVHSSMGDTSAAPETAGPARDQD